MSEISPKGSEMSATAKAEARGLFAVCIEYFAPRQRLKTAIPAVAHRVGITSPRRARAIYAGEARRIESYELDGLRAAAAKAEALRTAAQLDGAAHALVAMDSDFHGPEIARLRAAADQYRALAGKQGA